MILYHGNQNKNMIPKYGVGNKHNDYGLGLYTTDNIELAKEWSYSGYTNTSDGHWVHSWDLDIQKYSIYDLTKDDILYWLAQLYNFRVLDDLSEVQIDKLTKFQSIFYKDLTSYDIILGWRADDSYFRYARDFLSSNIYKSTLEEAIKLGNLGTQYFLQSKSLINSLGKSKNIIESESYYQNKYLRRDKIARNDYLLKKSDNIFKEKETIDDILRSY